MRKLLIVFMVFGLMPISGWSQKKGSATCRVISATTDNDAAHNGVLYSLPTTVIRVKVDADIVVRKAGPFYRYSQKYFNIADVIKEDETLWELKTVTLQPVGKPDASRMFKIETDGNGVAPLVNLTIDGVISGINQSNSPVCNHLLSNAIAFEKPVVSFDNVPAGEEVLTKTSLAAMAEEAAYAVYRLRKKRTNLLDDEGEKTMMNGSAIEAVLNEINRLESELMSMFLGAEKRMTITRYYDYIPDQASPSNNVLFRFSSQNGFLDKMNVSGTPVYIDVSPQDNARVNELPAGAKRSQEVNGLRYILPGKAVVKITDRNILLIEQEMMLAQFGQVASLPISVIQQSDIEIAICPATGALISVSRR